MTEYDALAAVYDWLVPAELLEPDASAEAFASVVDLAGGARVLDCACGPGHLAVGLALRGFAVVATDASAAMIERTRALAGQHGAGLTARRCAWEALGEHGWEDAFDAVFCVGNSLVHAPGAAARRAALAAMASVLRPAGALVVTSRNWEQLRTVGSGLEIAQEFVSRDGALGLPSYVWTIPDEWDEPHHIEIGVSLVGADGTVATHGERMQIWPFARETLDEDLRAVGLEPQTSTYSDEAPRYMVVARRAGPATASP